jgi:hypothetical protein
LLGQVVRLVGLIHILITAIRAIMSDYESWSIERKQTGEKPGLVRDVVLSRFVDRDCILAGINFIRFSLQQKSLLNPNQILNTPQKANEKRKKDVRKLISKSETYIIDGPNLIKKKCFTATELKYTFTYMEQDYKLGTIHEEKIKANGKKINTFHLKPFEELEFETQIFIVTLCDISKKQYEQKFKRNKKKYIKYIYILFQFFILL